MCLVIYKKEKKKDNLLPKQNSKFLFPCENKNIWVTT